MARNAGLENFKKFYFQLFMGVIIITMWLRLYATASNTYVAGPTLRIIMEMFRQMGNFLVVDAGVTLFFASLA